MSAAGKALEAAASTCGLTKMGDAGNNVSIHDVGGGVFDSSISIVKDGTWRGDAERRSFARRGFR